VQESARGWVYGDKKWAIFLADKSGLSSKGADFYVAFLANADSVERAVPLYQLLVTTDEPDPVTFTVSLN